MRVRDLGEFGLIDRLAAQLAAHGVACGSALTLGIGDDAALWAPTPGRASVLSVDLMLEGVHFTARTTPWPDLGWKSLAVNLSDLAAMGAVPRLALITLGLTGDEALADVDALYDGMAALARQTGTAVAGGDTIRAPRAQVGFTVVGEAVLADGGPRVLRRAAARPGDLLVVTGSCGDAAGGLELLLAEAPPPAAATALVEAHRRPRPRLREAQWLLEQGVRCATDSSDSLLREVELLCAASGVGAVVEAARLPLSPALRAQFPERAPTLALYGGEDYELVLAVDAASFPSLATGWREHFDVPLTVVGRFVERPAGPPVRVEGYDGPVAEYEHFPGASA